MQRWEYQAVNLYDTYFIAVLKTTISEISEVNIMMSLKDRQELEFCQK